MKTRVIYRFGLVVVLMASLLLSACAPTAPAAKESASSASQPQAFKVALLLPGSANDQSWNQLGYDGLQAIKKELGAEVAFSENVKTTDAVDALRDYASKGFNIIFVHGGEFEEAALKVAPEFPDLRIVVITGVTGNDTNVVAVDNAPWQYGYAYGYMAGKMTKTGRVGYVTALEGLPTIINLVGAWKVGLKAANPTAVGCVVYLSDPDDVAGAREAALAQIEAGADVVQHELGRGTQGVIDVAHEKGVWTVGRQDSDIERAPKEIMTVTMFDWNQKFVTLAKQAREGTMPTGAFFFGFHTPEAPGFTFEYKNGEWNPAIPDDVIKSFNQDVVQKFIKEPMMSFKPEDAKGGCE